MAIVFMTIVQSFSPPVVLLLLMMVVDDMYWQLPMVKIVTGST